LLVSDTSVSPWDGVVVEAKLRNTGDSPVPFGDGLLTGQYGGAYLILVVEEVATKGSRRLSLDPKWGTDCDRVDEGKLLPDQEASLTSLVGGLVGPVVNAERTGTDLVFLPLFPREGEYTLRIEYEYAGQVSASQAVTIVAHASLAADRATLESVERLGVKAYWLYEPTVISFGLHRDDLAPLAQIAEGHPCRYADFAALSLADYYLRNAQPFVDERMRVAPREHCLQEASRYLAGIASPSIAGSRPYEKIAAGLRKLQAK